MINGHVQHDSDWPADAELISREAVRGILNNLLANHKSVFYEMMYSVDLCCCCSYQAYLFSQRSTKAENFAKWKSLYSQAENGLEHSPLEWLMQCVKTTVKPEFSFLSVAFYPFGHCVALWQCHGGLCMRGEMQRTTHVQHNPPL